MKKLYFLLFTFLIAAVSFAQPVINEVDSDTPGSDIAEFIELLWTPNTSLDGYVVVLFNGSNSDLSYAAYDLDGYSTDANGFFVLGNTGLIPSPDLTISNNSVQNGADAIALYQANDTDFPNNTPVTTSNLVDALVYDTSDGDDTGLLTGLGETIQYDENANSNGANESLQRQNDGTYVAFAPTPKAQNTLSPPALYLIGLPANGGTIDIGPEDLAGEFEFATANFTVGEPGTGTEGDGYISWAIYDKTGGNNILHDSGDIYDISSPTSFIPLLPNKEYMLESVLKDNSGQQLLNPEAYYFLTANTLGYNIVSDIAALRSHVGTNGEGLYYEISGEVVITYKVTENTRNQKYVQDISGGILIDDPDDILATPFNIGDGISGLKGQISSYNGVLQILPSISIGSASSTGINIIPEEISASEFFTNGEDYESELIKITNITFTDAGGTFTDNTNYNIVDGGTTTICRVAFGDEDLIGATIPAGTSSVIGLGAEFGGVYQVYPRYLSDVEGAALSSEDFNTNRFSVYPNPTSYGYVNISSKSQTAMKVGVYDILGKQVINKTVSNNRLDVSNLTTGIYIMKISQNDATTTKKLVIK